MRGAFALRSPVRSDPAIAAVLDFRAHLLAILMVVAGCVVVGLSVTVLGYAVQLVLPALGAVMIPYGGVLAMSAFVTWLGHFPGAVVLHLAHRAGWGGWAVALLGGLVIGGVISALVGTGLPVIFGPLLALCQWAALRFLLFSKGRVRP